MKSIMERSFPTAQHLSDHAPIRRRRYYEPSVYRSRVFLVAVVIDGVRYWYHNDRPMSLDARCAARFDVELFGELGAEWIAWRVASAVPGGEVWSAEYWQGDGSEPIERVARF